MSEQSKEVGFAVRRAHRRARRAAATSTDQATADAGLVEAALTRLKALVTGGRLLDLAAARKAPSPEAIAAAKALRCEHGGQVRCVIRSKAFEALAEGRVRDLLLDRPHRDGVHVRPAQVPRQKT